MLIVIILWGNYLQGYFSTIEYVFRVNKGGEIDYVFKVKQLDSKICNLQDMFITLL